MRKLTGYRSESLWLREFCWHASENSSNDCLHQARSHHKEGPETRRRAKQSLKPAKTRIDARREARRESSGWVARDGSDELSHWCWDVGRADGWTPNDETTHLGDSSPADESFSLPSSVVSSATNVSFATAFGHIHSLVTLLKSMKLSQFWPQSAEGF